MRNNVVLCKKSVVLFTPVIFACMLLGCNANEVSVEEENMLMSRQVVEKFTIMEMRKGKLKMILEAKSALIDEKANNAHLEQPLLKFYDKGNYISTLVVESADINILTYDVKGKGQCSVDTANGEHLQTTDLMYDAKRELIYSGNNVKITKCGEMIYGRSFEADIKLDKIVVKNQRIVLD